MSEELKFQKLSEVELVEEASKNAHVLVEDEGKIKRVSGGVGSGAYVIDLTDDFITMMTSGTDFEENYPFAQLPITAERSVAIVNGLMRTNGAVLKIDLAKYLRTIKELYPDTDVLISESDVGVFCVSIPTVCTGFMEGIPAAYGFEPTNAILDEQKNFVMYPAFMIMGGDDGGTLTINMVTLLYLELILGQFME